MKHEHKISSVQLIALIQGGIIGITILSMPSKIISVTGVDGGLASLLGGVTFLTLALMVVKLVLYYKEETCIEFFPKIFGRPIGYGVNVLLICYFLVSVGLNSRIFADAIGVHLLPHTPHWAILLLFWGVVMYWVQFGMRALIIGITILFFPVLLGIGLMLGLSLNAVRWAHLLPSVAEGILPILQGAYHSLFYYFGIAPLFFIVPVLREPHKLYSGVIKALLIPLFVFTALIVVLIARFSSEEVKNMVYPVITMLKSFDVPGAFIERLEALFFITFTVISVNSISIYFYLAVLSLVRWTHKKYYRIYIALGGAAAFIISTLPKNLGQVNDLLNYVTYFGLFFVAVVSPAALVVTWIRRRRRRG